jgi:hypothetical protein
MVGRLPSIFLVLALGGCASFGEGVTRALIQARDEGPAEDTRRCEITGAAFAGLEADLRQQDRFPEGSAGDPAKPVLKVVMVHGIGTHFPGYSGRLSANLSRELGLTVTSPQVKETTLIHPRFPDEVLGTLTVQRFTDPARRREMLFYETTWSRLSDSAKEVIAFDNSNVYGRQRASLNQAAKGFVNDVSPDPLVYVGVGHNRILSAVFQSMCRAYSTGWDDFPEASTPCLADDPGFASRLEIDQTRFVTHSLGSRIILDSLQTLAGEIDRVVGQRPVAAELKRRMQEKTTTVFMLANQLPLLQSGFAPAAVSDQIADFCTPAGSRYADRLFRQVEVVAFSDPNDLVSYPIPDRFVQTYIDSRICPEAVNVTLNIAPVRSLFGLGDIADPLRAHLDYDSDERVIGLMAGGLGQPETRPAVTERCTWIEVDETLR